MQHIQTAIDKRIQTLRKRHDTRLNVALIYSVAVAASIVAVIIAFFATSVLGPNTCLLFFFPAVTISSWFGNSKSGMVTSVLTALAFYVLFFANRSHLTPKSSDDLGIVIFLLLGGLLISFAFDKVRGIEKVALYQKREKDYLDVILQLQKQNAKAQEEIKARDEFLSIASHELKTPVTAMLLQIQRSLHNIRNVSLAEFSVENLLKMLEGAETQSKRIGKMINDLLNVSLITTGRMQLEKEEADLSEIVKSVVEGYAERIQKEGYKVNLEADKKVVGMFDRLRIEQLVTNLLTNALRYGEKKPITIRVDKTHDMGEIIVQDNGIGIPKNQQDKIFARFVRGVNGEKFEGLGVGLYITSQIVSAHGGSISVDSDEGEGTTFTVLLPLHT